MAFILKQIMDIRSLRFNRHLGIVLGLDALLVMAAYLAAYFLRFEGRLPYAEWVNVANTLPFIVPLKIVCFLLFGLYRGMWRYTSLVDLINVIRACVVSSTVIVLIILFTSRFQGFSRSVYLIDFVLTLALIGGVRVAIRMLLAENQPFFPFFRRGLDSRAKKAVIIGAGDAAEMVLREIMENPGIEFAPLGLLDDDPQKQGRSIHGVPVLGTIDDIETITLDFDEILIAIPSASGEQMRRIVALCEKTGKRYRTMPSLGELIDGKVSVRKLRQVKLEDLLGRDEIRLDREVIRRFLQGRRILVTGAGGSIGSELVRQICRFQPRELALLEFSEYNLFRTELRCRQDFRDIAVRSYLRDIRDMEGVRRVFATFNPEVVFHAAAYKHVPLQEMNPQEAVFNNILGTRNLVDAACESGVESFVFVSTDKAVRPTNVMGATKRVAEMYVGFMNGSARTRFMAVRFGNVLGSSGSVVPIFQQQIADGHPVTVTHPDVTRYFMTIPEACQLILQAGAMGEGGEVFILDMGKPVRIADMARDLIHLHGLEPERDVPIIYIGLRPGEKLHEELITEGEGIAPTTHAKIRVIHGQSGDLNSLGLRIDDLISVAGTYDAEKIREKLKEIIPEYTPPQYIERAVLDKCQA